jgi:ribosomal-protein-alanine N-acetyltransferase
VALEQLEEFVTSNLQISRIEIRMAKENRASQKIAMKSGYKKEGVLRQMLFVEDKWYDCYLYSKIL